MARQFFAVALILLTLTPTPADDAFPAATTTPVAMQSEADQLVLASFLKHVDGAVARLTPEAMAKIEQVEDICWIWSRYASMPLVAFELTGDAQIEVDIAEFEVVHLICRFVEQVNATPTLERIHGDTVSRFLDIAENHLAGKKWEERELYMDLGVRGAVFRMPAECGNNRDHLTNPHNKQSKMCRA